MSVTDDRTTCSFCPKLCRHECPTAVAEKSEVATPTWRQQLARAQSAGTPLDADAASAFWKCTGCGASASACRHGIDLEPSMRDARAMAVRGGLAPATVVRVAARFQERGSPYPDDLARILRELVPQPLRRATAPVLLLPSCTALARHPDEVTDSRVALEATGRPDELAVALPEPACCGYPLDALGLADAFAAHAKRVAQGLVGFGRIVPLGAACAWTLAVRYPEVGAPLPGKVVPFVDELAARADAIRVRRRGRTLPGAPFAYHDPCFLGRHLGRYEAPRAVIAAATGEPPRELDRNREHGYCSGAGGGYALTNPDGAREIAQRLLEAFRRSGAQTLVTACSSTRRLLEKTDPSAPIASLAALASRACGGTS